MVMRYFGGGIGHLKNTPPQQVPGFDPINLSSEEIAMEEEDSDDLDPDSNEGPSSFVQQPSEDVIINSLGEVEVLVGEDDKDEEEVDDSDSDDDDEGGDQTDEDDESGSSSGRSEEEGVDDDGYASL